MKTHAFGLTSSPLCAKVASELLSTCLYIDDGICAMPSSNVAVKLIDEAVTLCKKGGLTLQKFISNCPLVMQHVNANYSNESTIETPGSSVERLLGVVWCVENDTFQDRISTDSKPFTRQGVLSTVSAIYVIFSAS